MRECVSPDKLHTRACVFVCVFARASCAAPPVASSSVMRASNCSVSLTMCTACAGADSGGWTRMANLNGFDSAGLTRIT